MDDMMAYCGLVCSECPAYKGTQADDMDLLERTARTWSEAFGHEIPVETIRCDGCRTEGGRKAGFCSMCNVRACNVERGLVSCATCPDYVCTKLEDFFKMAPEARQSLERLRAGGEGGPGD